MIACNTVFAIVYSTKTCHLLFDFAKLTPALTPIFNNCACIVAEVCELNKTAAKNYFFFIKSVF